MRLTTVTMCNADVLVEMVAEVLPEVMECAERFTTYNDASDIALLTSECLQRLLPKASQQGRVGGWSTSTFGRQVSALWLEPSESGHGVVLAGPMIDHAKQKDGRAIGTNRTLLDATLEIGRMVRQFGECIDVIDATSIDQNVGDSRHNYYVANTQVVEDICELIGQGVGAQRRTRRLIRVDQESNVFLFLAPPAHLSY